MMITLIKDALVYSLDNYIDKSSIVYSDNIDTTKAHGGFSIPFIKSNAISGLDFSKPLARLTKFVLDVDGEITYWKLAEDKVNKVRKGDSPLYSHEITLIEPTVDLENRPLPDMTVTQPKGALTDYIYAIHTLTEADLATGIEFDDTPVLIGFNYGTSNDNTVIDENELQEVRPYEIRLNYEIVNRQYDTLGVDSPEATFMVEIYAGATKIYYASHTIGKARSATEFNRINFNDEYTYTPAGVELITVKFKTTTLVNSTTADTLWLGKMGFAILTYDDTADTPKITLDEVVDKILMITQSAPLSFPEQEFTLASQTRERIKTVVSPEFTFKGYTVFDALNEVASYVGAIVYLGNGDFTTVWFHFYDDVSDESGIEYLEEEQNVYLNDYVTGLEINAQNVIKEDNPRYAMVEPSETGWASIRGDGIGQISDANGKIHTSRPFYKSNKLLVKGLEFEMLNGATPVTFANTIEWDVSAFVVEQTKWNALENIGSGDSRTTALNKGNTVYYTQGSPHIHNIFYNDVILAPLWNTAVAANYAIVEAILCKAQNENPTYTFADDYLISDVDIFALRFRTYYMPYSNARVTVYRDDAALLNKSVKYFNESASINDMKSLGDIAKRHVNRKGNVVASYWGFTSSIYNLIRLGMKNSRNEILTSYDISVNQGIREFVLHYSKDNPNISAYKGTPSAYRQYEIPVSDLVYRKDKYTEYVYLTETAEASTNTIYEVGELLNNFKPTPTGLKLTYALIMLDYDGDGYTETVEATVDTLAFGNTTAIQIEMADNYSAGAKQVSGVVKTPTGSETQIRQADTLYGDSLGRVENIKILTYTTYAVTPDTYPDNDVTTTGEQSNLEIKVKKDAREIWGITQELVFRSNYDNIRIYSGMAKFNGIVAKGSTVECRPFLLKKGYYPTNESIDLSRTVQTVWNSIITGDELYTEFTVPIGEYEGYIWLEMTSQQPIFAVQTDAFDTLAGGDFGHSVFISTSYAQINVNYSESFAPTFNITDTWSAVKFQFPVLEFSDTLGLTATLVAYRSTNIVVDLTPTINLSDTWNAFKSTNFDVELSDTIGVSSTVTETKFEFPLLDLEATMNITDICRLFKSTNFVFEFSDTLGVSSQIAVFTSGNYVMDLNASISLIDTIVAYISTDYTVDLEADIGLSDSMTAFKSTDFVVDFSDTLGISGDINEYLSTNYTDSLSDSFTVSDSLTVVQSTDYIITLSDGFTISSSISSEQTTTNWIYIGTSGSYNKNVTYVASGSTCAISSVIDAWLETNYPATDYAYGYVIRVARANEDLVPCTPSAYYYSAT